MLTVSRATPELLRELAGNLRPEDEKEVRASTGADPVEALLAAKEPWVALNPEGRPVVAFGVEPHPQAGIGVPWLLATSEVHKYRIEIAKRAPRILRAIAAPYRVLFNFAWEKNYLHLRWCQRMGFTLGRFPAIYSNGLIFISITKDLR